MRGNFEEKDKSTSEVITYQVKNMTYVVNPVFNTDSEESLASILLRLMKADKEKEK
jgi:hypothetical protein